MQVKRQLPNGPNPPVSSLTPPTGEKYVRINAARAWVFLVGDFRSFAL